MPGKPDPADKLYNRLMQLQEEAFEAGRFEVAYHLMAAALHAAEELHRVDLLDELGRRASSRQTELDSREPEHAISSASAQRRGQSALFATLATTAAAARSRVAAQAAVGRLRERTGGAD